MPKLYKINAEEISKLVSESKKPRNKKQKLMNSDLPPKKLPKIEKVPLKRTEAEISIPSPKPSEEEPDQVMETVPEPLPEPTLPIPVPEPEPEPIIEEVEEVEEKEEEPPKWFQKFVLQVKEEQERQAREAGERKIPQRVIKEEAEQIAQERWQDPRLRERVENKLTRNLESIYSMVFPNRQY